MIQAKVKGREPKLKEEERPQEADVIDLMERLQRSLSAGNAKSGRTGRKNENESENIKHET